MTFHNIMTQAKRDLFSRSSVYLPAKKIQNYFNSDGNSNLVISHYHEDGGGSERVMLSLANGFRIVEITATNDKFYVNNMDWPMGAMPFAASSNRSELAQSKNSNYIAKVATDRSKGVNRRINSGMTSATSYHIANMMVEVENQISVMAPKIALPTISPEDTLSIMECVLNLSDKAKQDQELVARIHSVWLAYATRKTAQEKHDDRVDAMIGVPKWLVAYSEVYGSGNYFVSSIKAGSKLVDNHQFDCMNSIYEAPVEYRDKLVGALTMTKLYMDKNHRGVSKKDKDGFFLNSTAFEFVDAAGVVMWEKYKTHFMLLDK